MLELHTEPGLESQLRHLLACEDYLISSSTSLPNKCYENSMIMYMKMVFNHVEVHGEATKTIQAWK